MYSLPKNTRAKSNQIINVEDLVIAPGFIDVHSHTERALINPESNLNEAFIRQGVTTIVGGPDGSLGPTGIKKLIEAMNDYGAGTNVATYVGHNAIRREVMKDDYKRYATENELKFRQVILQEVINLLL